jgi:hypothetical protein
VRVAASSGFLAALRQGGLSAVTGVVVTAAPTAVQVRSTAVADANSSKAQPSSALAGLAVLVVLLPMAGLAVWLRRRNRRAMDSDVAVAAAVEPLPDWVLPSPPQSNWDVTLETAPGASPVAKMEAQKTSAAVIVQQTLVVDAGQHLPPLEEFAVSQAPVGERAADELLLAQPRVHSLLSQAPRDPTTQAAPPVEKPAVGDLVGCAVADDMKADDEHHADVLVQNQLHAEECTPLAAMVAEPDYAEELAAPESCDMHAA